MMKMVFVYILLFWITPVLFGQTMDSSRVENPGKPQSKRHKRGEAIQEDDYFEKQPLLYENAIYKPYIKTVQFSSNGFEIGDPYLNLLNNQEKMVLSFDDINAGQKSYQYTVIHCNANWEPSQLFPADYLTGFTEDMINNYSYSINTWYKYAHYEVSFPNQNFQLTKTGNYLLKVYQDYDPENVVLTRRFMVYEDNVIIMPSFHRPSIINNRNNKQEIDVTFSYSGLNVLDVFSDFKMVLLQNNRWDNAIQGLKPNFVKDNELVYDYDEDNNFYGGNEFRYFDTRNLQLNNDRVIQVKFIDSLQHVFLNDDLKRSYKRYSIQFDINGKYYIKNLNGYTGATDADYVKVHFYLKTEQPIKEGDVYVFGALTDWTIKKDFKMKFDESTGTYKCEALLKQGYYNYEYVVTSDNDGKPDNTAIEGSFFETENDYTVLLYVRTMGKNYDQLIGIKRFNTNK